MISFKNITPHCVVTFEDSPDCFNADEKYKVESTRFSSYGNKEFQIELFTGPDDYGESDGYLEHVGEQEFTSCGGKVVRVPTDSQKGLISELDSLIASIGKQANEIEKKAREAGLDYEVVVISDVGSLAEWHSSKC